MAEVQWIKLKVGMFDGNSFKKIKRAKIGGVSYRDKLTAVWFELLDLAGKSNANGYLIDNNEIPYRSFEDIATMLDREEKEIELCMQFFISERMVEIIDDVYCLSNFVRFQNQEGLDKIREQTRKRVARCREKKLLAQSNVTESVTSPLRNDIEEDIEEDIEKDKEKKDKSKAVKHKHGEYGNVLLTDKELQSLKSDYSNSDSLIKYLDEYIEMKGYKAKSHYLCIKKWVVDAVNKKPNNSTTTDQQTDALLKMFGGE